MLRFPALCLSFLAICTTVALADPPATAPADPMALSRRIDQQIHDLTESTPAATEMRDVSTKLQQIEAQRTKDSQPLYTQLQQIQATEAYRQYTAKCRELEAQRQDQWIIERKAMAASAKTLYEARHAELRTHPADVSEGLKLGFDVLSFPRLDGSTSTHPLNVIIASRLLRVPYEWIYPEPTGWVWGERAVVPSGLFLAIDGGRYTYNPENYEFTLAASRIVAKPLAAAGTAQERTALMINSLLAVSTSTHDAYVNLIAGKCDLNLNARGPSASERKLAEEKGVKITLKPIAQDALVFIVHRSNPIPSLTLAQLRDIYHEKTRQWRDVAPDAKLIDEWKVDSRMPPGDAAKEIRPLRREPDSGSRELFDALVMQGQPLPEPDDKWAKLIYSSSMAGPYNRITQEPLALGYSVYYYEHFMALSAYTRTLAIDGVEPTPATIASGKYPLSAPVYAAYRASDPPDSPAMKLLAWLLSPEGQAVIRESGYVPLK